MDNHSQKIVLHIEEFSADLKRRCKARAAEEEKSLRDFVTAALEAALTKAVLDSTHESGQDTIRRGPSPYVGAPTTKNIRDKKAKKKDR